MLLATFRNFRYSLSPAWRFPNKSFRYLKVKGETVVGPLSSFSFREVYMKLKMKYSVENFFVCFVTV